MDCAALGGEVRNERVCSGVDAADTFCIVDSADAFPCRGLFAHARRCNEEFRRPALDPFLCAERCEGNGAARGKECGVRFGGNFFAAADAGESGEVESGGAQFTVVYHGARRGLHYAYFTERVPPALMNDEFNPDIHAAYCDLGDADNSESDSAQWRPPFLLEAHAFVSDMESDSLAGRHDGGGLPDSDSVLRDVFSLPFSRCSVFSFSPGGGLVCADAAALDAAGKPVAVGLGVEVGLLGVEQGESMIGSALLHPAGAGRFALLPYAEGIADEIIVPCVLPVEGEYAAPPNPAEVEIIPSGVRFASFADIELTTPVSDATLAHLSYAAPDATALRREDSLLTVTVLARRWERDGFRLASSSSVSVSVRVGRSEFSYESVEGNGGRLDIPLLAGTVILPSPLFLLTVSILATPEFGPEKRAEFLYVNIPVSPPGRGDVTVQAGDGMSHATLRLPAEMAGEPERGAFSIAATIDVAVSATFSISVGADNTLLVRRGPMPTAERERVLVRFTHPRLRGNLTLAFHFYPPASGALAAKAGGNVLALDALFPAAAVIPPECGECNHPRRRGCGIPQISYPSNSFRISGATARGKCG